MQNLKTTSWDINLFVVHTWKKKENVLPKKITQTQFSQTKEATDDNYNAAVDFVLENLDRVAAFFGTHNEKSTKTAIDKMKNAWFS